MVLTIELTKEMELGIPKVDNQHRELISRINKVANSKAHTKEEAEETLDMLGEYIVKHFGDEEEMQRQSNYPKYQLHRHQHEIFVTNFHRLRSEFILNGNTVKFHLALSKTIIDWIVNHIVKDDVEFGKYYKSLA